MWKLAALACLVVVCTADPIEPPRPKIPETFDAKGNVMVHRRESHMGNGRITRNQMKGEGLEVFALIEPPNINMTKDNQTDERLERYDMGEEYMIHINASSTHCQSEKTTTKEIPPFWGWLEMARYAGNHTEHMLDLDFWTYHAGGGVRLLVGVGRTDADRNTPYFFAREIAESRLEMEITAFNTMVPDDIIFKVPSACMR